MNEENRLIRSARILRAFFEHKLKLELELLTEAPREPLESGLQFDLQLSDHGIWGLRSNEPISEKTQSEISSTFHGLLGAFDKVQDQSMSLQRLENKLKMTAEDLPSNVIPIHRTLRPQRRPIYSVTDRRWILRLDCLIECVVEEDIQKMALELHTQSGRYAFIDYHNLDSHARASVSDLMQMGAITLFVPSILALSAMEQQILRELIVQGSVDRPLLMVGAPISFSDLRTEPSMDLEFLVLLARAYIKLSKPFKEYKDQGLIHYFLDSLSQNPS